MSEIEEAKKQYADEAGACWGDTAACMSRTINAYCAKR